MSGELNIRVHEFFQQADEVKGPTGKPTGEIVVRDYVKYGPPHLGDRSVIIARVERMSRASKPNDGSKNPHEWTAWNRWMFMKPLYEAWKRGEELPEDGIPLAACNFLRPEDVAILKRSNVRSVQDLATLPDVSLDKIAAPAMREKRAQAKRFLEATDANKAAAQMAERDEKIAELERKLMAIETGALADPLNEPLDEPQVDEHGDKIPRRRGRPPKISHEPIEVV